MRESSQRYKPIPRQADDIASLDRLWERYLDFLRNSYSPIPERLSFPLIGTRLSYDFWLVMRWIGHSFKHSAYTMMFTFSRLVNYLDLSIQPFALNLPTRTLPVSPGDEQTAGVAKGTSVDDSPKYSSTDLHTGPILNWQETYLGPQVSGSSEIPPSPQADVSLQFIRQYRRTIDGLLKLFTLLERQDRIKVVYVDSLRKKVVKPKGRRSIIPCKAAVPTSTRKLSLNLTASSTPKRSSGTGSTTRRSGSLRKASLGPVTARNLSALSKKWRREHAPSTA